MARTRKGEVYRRQLQVKKLYLKGHDVSAIAAEMKVTEPVVRKDIREINKWYLKSVEQNPHILEKQAEYILKHLDELKLVKQKLWEVESGADSDKSEIAALKGVLDVLNHEAKVLKLIDVSKTITQYIHVDKIGILVNKTIEVIEEFVPLDKRSYALARLKALGQDIVDM